MRTNDIEMSVPIGRTLTGEVISVQDIMKVIATVCGVRLGSTRFDQILNEPQLLHAPDTLANAQRYGLLCSILDGIASPPEGLCVHTAKPEGGMPSECQLSIPATSNAAQRLSDLLDSIIQGQNIRSTA